MAHLQWAFLPFFCSVHSPLTFSFIVIWHLFSNNLHSNSTKNRTPATVTSTVEGKYHLIPWWRIYDERFHRSFVPLILHYPSFSLLLGASCQKISTATAQKREQQQHQNQRVSAIRSLDGVFMMIVFAVLFLRSLSVNHHFNCCLVLICFIFIIVVSLYSCCVYLHKSAQQHNTTQHNSSNNK